ncbi:hypothetical protein AAL_05285 [Moelleriella libera RCEF 2490]|uniref:Ankyrin repeat-containing domain protein n=1 Tax=Moelleriella libera RCEF 2490 TaxID=1081109 RepID=A0A168AT86_9HYPO|nr:hypothetical protein AAL_05285 [Moelleriella libera RCEF 2490]
MSCCKTCEEPLVLLLEDDADDETTEVAETVPDDLELRCGCHFHCCESYLPENEAGSSAISNGNAKAGNTTILAQYSNEGGVQRDLNIMDSLTEEAYIQNHPETQPARAFHVMCAEGDVASLIDLLRDANEQDGDVGSIIRYQDPLAEMKSGLHLAVENQQEEIVWTLLWLSSTVPTESFPMLVRQTADGLGLGRLPAQADTDIRGLRDYQGRTAETIARQNPGALAALLDAGALAP